MQSRDILPSPTSTSTGDSEVDASTNEEHTESGSHDRPSPDRTPRIGYKHSPRTATDIDVIPPSPSLKTLRAAASPIWALASAPDISAQLDELSLVEPTPDSTTKPIPTPVSASSPAEREFIVPLASDLAFFRLLTAALTSLSEFHAAQQFTFRQSVSALCSTISRSIQPQNSVSVLSSPFTPSPSTRLQHSSSKASKRDLYVWREIFTLWIEAEIFESSTERTRGERTVEQAETRLKGFANDVFKRRLGDRRTMKGKLTREAWEEFLRLNVLLLDLKRFQMANINAARKYVWQVGLSVDQLRILKKHDKRTALTASAGFPSFVRSTLSAQVDKDGNVSTWAFCNTSLPHVLLASLTDTLLP